MKLRSSMSIFAGSYLNKFVTKQCKYTVFRKKNTHLHFLSYLHEWCVDLNKNCSEYTQGKVDSDNVQIRYSLRPLTSLWCRICLAKVVASLQNAISLKPRISFLASIQGTCWCVDAVISYIMWWNINQFNIKQLFIHKPDYVRLPLMWDNVTATECCWWRLQILQEKSDYLWHFNSSVTK